MNWKHFAAVVAVSCAGLLPAQEPQGGALSKDVKGMYTAIKNNILKAADRMPEENYSFKPVDSVRTYGQILAHVADAQYLFCATDQGAQRPGESVEKTKTSKADITAALKEAFAYCDKSYDALTDAKLAEPVTFFGQQRSRLGLLATNVSHDNEHYGNMVTYLRIKGLTPPTSDPRPPKKK